MISVITCSIKPDICQRMLDSISETVGVEFETIVFDNREKNYGICKAYNEAAKTAKGEYLCFVHEDIVIKTNDWGKELVMFIEQNNNCGVIGIGGGKTVNRNFNGWWSSSKNLFNVYDCCGSGKTMAFSESDLSHKYKNPDNELFSKVVCLDGIFLFVKNDIWENNKFDENTFKDFHFYDADFSFNISQKYQNYVYFGMNIYHYSAGNIERTFCENMYLFQKKWKSKLPYCLQGKQPDFQEELKRAKYVFFLYTNNGFSYEESLSRISEINEITLFEELQRTVVEDRRRRTNLIEELKQTPFIKEEYIEYLQNSKLPLILYGAGELAEIARGVLDRLSIKIDFVVIDKEYWQPNTIFYGIEIQTLDDILVNNIKVNILVAFICDENSKKKIEELNKCKNVQRAILMPLYARISMTRYDNDFLDKNASFLTNIYNNLSDDLSRQIMFEYIRKLRSKTSLSDKKALAVSDGPQYFPDFLRFGENEVFVDCGAFDGDTIDDFLIKTSGKFEKIFAFEPDSVIAEKLRKKITIYKLFKSGDANVYLFERGVWSENTTLYFSGQGNAGSCIIETGNIQIEVDSIDNVCGNEKVTFIKMDIEGSELEALKGAGKTIKANKPKLAICVYHKEEDLIAIPQYILLLNPEYKLYLRYYGPGWADLVLYAVQKKEEK